MNLFQLNCFLAVAEHMNFARAAAELHVTHPAVSQQIRSLEKELGVLLFQRTTRSVKLTEEGKSFLFDAKQMVQIADRAKNRFARAGQEELQFLTIGCTGFPALFRLTGLMQRLRAAMPGLHPRLEILPFQHIFQRLEEGDLDLVAAFERAPDAKPRTKYKELARIPMVLLCPRDHPLAGRETVCTREIAAERLVLFEPHKLLAPIAQPQGELIGGKAPGELYFCASSEAISVLVAAGYGVSLLPELLTPERPEFARVPVADLEPLSFGFHYRPETAQENTALKTLLRCAGDACTT